MASTVCAQCALLDFLWPVFHAGAVAGTLMACLRVQSLVMMRILPLVPLLVIALGGCASLSESECADADWEQIGYRDGAGGASGQRIAAHAKACAEYGVSVDQDTWRAGYDRGIDSYCTPANAVREGLSGAMYSGVCPGETGVMFESYYRAGREVQEQRQRIDAIENRRRTLMDALDNADDENTRRTLLNELRYLDATLRSEFDRLRYLEYRLRP